MRAIYKDKAGNRLFADRKAGAYYAKNTKGQLMSKHGVISMLKEKGIGVRGLKQVYKGKRK